MSDKTPKPTDALPDAEQPVGPDTTQADTDRELAVQEAMDKAIRDRTFKDGKPVPIVPKG